MSTTLYLPAPPSPRVKQMTAELKEALDSISKDDLAGWAKDTPRLFGKAAWRRGAGVVGLAKKLRSLSEAAASEFRLTYEQTRQGNLKSHLRCRGNDVVASGKGKFKTYQGQLKTIACQLKNDPYETAPKLLGCVLGAYLGFELGSGGLDGNGGIPDLDITVFGIGGHRSLAFHSVVPGILVEGGIYAVLGLVSIGYRHLPAKHDRLWDQLHQVASSVLESTRAGISAGIAYHLLVDGLIQVEPYKDLPFSMPIEWHQALITSMGIAEASAIKAHSQAKERVSALKTKVGRFLPSPLRQK